MNSKREVCWKKQETLIKCLTEFWTAHRPAGGGSSIEPSSYFDFIHPFQPLKHYYCSGLSCIKLPSLSNGTFLFSFLLLFDFNIAIPRVLRDTQPPRIINPDRPHIQSLTRTSTTLLSSMATKDILPTMNS